ncbi:hypothetical protein H4Q26_012110 [Puccinia striiformis f. sp. tritici PST-130]|nr:hypothetical protein H4Q26_012110 [Puccinia striiformis f. sp. tritici PST-130]
MPSNRGLAQDLVELLKAPGHSLPIPYPLIGNSKSPILNGNDFDEIRLTQPELFSKSSARSLAVYIQYILASRFDSFTLALIKDLNRPLSDTSSSPVFNTQQQILIYQIRDPKGKVIEEWYHDKVTNKLDGSIGQLNEWRKKAAAEGAMNVCVHQPSDWQLALAIVLAYEGDCGPVVEKLLKKTVLLFGFST